MSDYPNHGDKEYRLDEFLMWIRNLAEDQLGLAVHDDATLTKKDFLHLAIDANEIVGCADCAICAVDCNEIDEYYMVTNELWAQYGVRHGMLCVGCMEARMGRELTGEDFMVGAGDNDPGQRHSARLTKRLFGEDA
jgi:hypothetical protein